MPGSYLGDHFSDLHRSADTAADGGTFIVDQHQGAIIVVTGTFTGTLVPEVTISQTTWFGIRVSNLATGQFVETITAAGVYFLASPGATRMRVRLSAISLGLVTVSVREAPVSFVAALATVPVSIALPIRTALTPTTTLITSSTTSQLLFASNTSAIGRTIFNASSNVLYVRQNDTASTTLYKVQIGSLDYFEFPSPLFTGNVYGVWAATQGGALVEEQL